jgi:hypothetical protein
MVVKDFDLKKMLANCTTRDLKVFGRGWSARIFTFRIAVVRRSRGTENPLLAAESVRTRIG